MTPERIAEIRSRVAAASAGPWVAGDAQPYSPTQRSPFSDYGASITVGPDDDFGYIVVGGEQDEQGGSVGILRNEDAAFIAHARQDVPDLLNALAAERARAEAAEAELAEIGKIVDWVVADEAERDTLVQAVSFWMDELRHWEQEIPRCTKRIEETTRRAEAAEAELAKYKPTPADDLGPCARCEQTYTKWELLGVSEQKHDVCYALDRAEAAEGREARLRPVWDAVERMQVVRASMYGLVDTVLDDDSAVEAVGNAMESANRALFSAALDVLDVYRAALVGTPEGEPTLAPRESYPATIIVTEVRRGEPVVYPDETMAPECRDGWHAVKTGAAACLCGENRMELLL